MTASELILEAKKLINFENMKTFNKLPLSEQNIQLDKVTGVFLIIMNSLTEIEKHLIYSFIMRPRRVTCGVVEKYDPKNYLRIKDLIKELALNSKMLSVYVNRLVDKGLIERKSINNKDYEYRVGDQLFISWFEFRNKMRMINVIN